MPFPGSNLLFDNSTHFSGRVVILVASVGHFWPFPNKHAAHLTMFKGRLSLIVWQHHQCTTILVVSNTGWFRNAWCPIIWWYLRTNFWAVDKFWFCSSSTKPCIATTLDTAIASWKHVMVNSFVASSTFSDNSWPAVHLSEAWPPRFNVKESKQLWSPSFSTVLCRSSGWSTRCTWGLNRRAFKTGRCKAQSWNIFTLPSSVTVCQLIMPCFAIGTSPAMPVTCRGSSNSSIIPGS